MIKHKWMGFLAALLMAASVLFVGIGYFKPSVFELFTGAAAQPYVTAMDKTKVLDMQIIVDEADWADMLENALDEEYIPATVIIDGKKIETVGIRPKGNSSLSMVAQDDTSDRYSFKIEFDHYVTGQTWLGLDKIVVNNMQSDATYMKEYLSYDLMAYVGVETPLYTFSNLRVNGEDWGFYLAVEVLEDSYATRVYGNDHGKLYKPESMGKRGSGKMNDALKEMQENKQSENSSPAGNTLERQRPTGEQGQPPTGDATNANSTGALGENSPQPENAQERQRPPGEQGQPPTGDAANANSVDRPGGFSGGSGGSTLQYTDDEISNYSAIFENAVFKSTERDYKRVINALKKLNAGEDLSSVVDVEATLKYFAAHAVIVNLDSYVSSMSHNYYLYEKNGQLTMLPWDFNLAFGGFQSDTASSVVNFPIDTPVSGVNLEDRPILAKLLEVPEYSELYHDYLKQIIDGYFNSGLFTQTIDSLDVLISPYVEADPSAFYDFAAYQSGVAELKKLGILRAQSIEGQLEGTIPSTTAGQKANSEALVDASSINLSALGSMGGGGGRQGGGGAPGGGDRPGGSDDNAGSTGAPGAANDFGSGAAGTPRGIGGAPGDAGAPGGGGGNRPGSPDRDGWPPGGPDGMSAEDVQENSGSNVNPNNTRSSFDQTNMKKAQEIIATAGEDDLTPEQLTQLQELGFTEDQITKFKNGEAENVYAGSGRSGKMQANNNNQPPRGNQNDGKPVSSITSEFDMKTWIVLGISSVLLLGGILFVVFYKRRRSI